MLQSVPSLSIFSSVTADCVEEHEKGLGRDELMGGNERLERSVTIGDSIEAIGSGDFSFAKNTMGLIHEEEDDKNDLSEFQNMGIKEEEDGEGEGEGVEAMSPSMYLATGFGIEGTAFGCGNPTTTFDDESSEDYYQRMIVEDPCNPLFLSNYAQLLQSKGDLLGAEEFYSRAALADPRDGEILLQYAKLVWELHHDQDKALIYFERAVLAVPHDSHVLAAYASFLWEIDEGEDEDHTKNDDLKIPENDDPIGVRNPTNSGDNGDLDEHYKRMIEESPCNSLLLRNYAQFLLQSTGDRWRAEEYYSRAIGADPEDGETISQYAKLVWELHRDHVKATSYFERAVEASPGDCHVLAAYASFLWEAEDEEEDEPLQDQL